MTNFSDRLILLMREADISQARLARETGASKATVNKWVNRGSVPESRYMQKLEVLFGTTSSWLIEGKGARSRKGGNIYSKKGVPVISSIQAGAWSESAVEEFLDDMTEILPVLDDTPEDAFALKVSGDSMLNPAGFPTIPQGSYVIVRPAQSAENGQIVVAILDGSAEATIKKLQIDGPSKYLVPLNPRYNPIIVNNDCRIVGVVIDVYQRMS